MLVYNVIRSIYRYYFRVGIRWLLVEYATTAVFALLLLIFGRRLGRPKRIIADLFFFYAVTVFVATVLARSSGTIATYNLDLFWSFRAILAGSGDSWLATIENVVLFVPFGLLVPELIPRRGRAAATVLLGVSFSMWIEGLQLVLRKGLFELDDFVTNTAGTVVGYLLYLEVKWVIGQLDKERFTQ